MKTAQQATGYHKPQFFQRAGQRPTLKARPCDILNTSSDSNVSGAWPPSSLPCFGTQNDSVPALTQRKMTEELQQLQDKIENLRHGLRTQQGLVSETPTEHCAHMLRDKRNQCVLNAECISRGRMMSTQQLTLECSPQILDSCRRSLFPARGSVNLASSRLCGKILRQPQLCCNTTCQDNRGCVKVFDRLMPSTTKAMMAGQPGAETGSPSSPTWSRLRQTQEEQENKRPSDRQQAETLAKELVSWKRRYASVKKQCVVMRTEFTELVANYETSEALRKQQRGLIGELRQQSARPKKRTKKTQSSTRKRKRKP